MNIRKVNKEDFDDILNLQLQLEDTEIRFDYNLKERCFETIKGKEKLKNRINNEKNIFYVAVNENNKVIAFADGNIPDDEWWYKDSVAYLNHICVDEGYRNQGIAKMLLKQFEETARQKDASMLDYLHFLKMNQQFLFIKIMVLLSTQHIIIKNWIKFFYCKSCFTPSLSAPLTNLFELFELRYKCTQIVHFYLIFLFKLYII